MERFFEADLHGAEFRECDLSGARLIGVVMQDAVIDGLVTNLVVNGVEVTGYVDAELDRRHPVRPLLRSDDPTVLMEGWRRVRADWVATVERLRRMPEGSESRRVDGEWSAVETMRHLVFVHDSWFRRCCLGRTQPFTSTGLAADFVPHQADQGLDPEARPGLGDVLAVRDEQAAELDDWLSAASADDLTALAPIPDDAGWPPYAHGRTVAECLRTVLNEEWAHHGFCVRDLDRLSKGVNDV
jgi:hypothetical protein